MTIHLKLTKAIIHLIDQSNLNRQNISYIQTTDWTQTPHRWCKGTGSGHHSMTVKPGDHSSRVTRALLKSTDD